MTSRETSPLASMSLPGTRHCPQCGSSRVHRSRRHSSLDRFITQLGAQIRRCHDCRTRWAWFGFHPVPLWETESNALKLAKLSFLGSAVTIGLVVVWHMI